MSMVLIIPPSQDIYGKNGMLIIILILSLLYSGMRGNHPSHLYLMEKHYRALLIAFGSYQGTRKPLLLNYS